MKDTTKAVVMLRKDLETKNNCHDKDMRDIKTTLAEDKEDFKKNMGRGEQ